MKTSIKLAIASLLVVGGVANAANINTLPTASTGSSLVLFLKDGASSFYVEQMNVTIGALNSLSNLTANASGNYSLAGTGNNGSLTVPNALAGYTSANLATYVAAHSQATWTILAAKSGDDQAQAGNYMALTSNSDWVNDLFPTGGDIAAQGVLGVSNFFGEINGATFTNGVSSSAGWGSAGNFGQNAPGAWFGSNQVNGAKVGVGQSLFELVGNGDSLADVYKSVAKLTLGTNGVLSYTGADLGAGTSPVPVPAAVWLLGSGLAGLAGIGRRRKLIA